MLLVMAASERIKPTQCEYASSHGSLIGIKHMQCEYASIHGSLREDKTYAM